MSNLGNVMDRDDPTHVLPRTDDPTDAAPAPAVPDAAGGAPAHYRPPWLDEANRTFAPGAPGAVVSLGLAVLLAAAGQFTVPGANLVVPVVGLCVLVLVLVRVFSAPPPPTWVRPVRRAPVAPPGPPPSPAASADLPPGPGASSAEQTLPSVIVAPPDPAGTPGHPPATPGPILGQPPAPGGPVGTLDAPPAAAHAVAAAPIPATTTRAAETSRRLAPREWLVWAAVAAGVFTWALARGRPAEAGYAPVVALWLLGIALALVATVPSPWPTAPHWQALWRARALPRTDWLLLGGLIVAALLPRVIGLDRLPYIMGGDEGSQAMAAVDILAGKPTNPFGTGWYVLPTMFFYWQALSIQLFGDSVAGVRVVSGIAGALAVGLTYVYVRRLFGRTVALAAAALLGGFHFHLLFSRLASVQVTDTLFLVAVLFLLDRALFERRPLDAVLAGLAIGYSQYFHFASRIILVVALAYVVYAALFDGERLRPRLPRRETWRALGPVVGWLVLGAAVVYAPLLAYYQDNPFTFTARIDQVSMFSSGWLAREQELTRQGVGALILQQFWRAAMLPFTTPPGGWYGGITPIIGLPMAVPFGIGLVIVTLGAWRRRYFGLAVAYWLTILGLGLTEDPTQTQRFVIAAGPIAILAALGICLPLRFASFLLAVPRALTGAAVAGVVLVLLGWNLTFFFLAPYPLERYGSTNGLVATELAYYLRGLGASHTVYFFGPKRMWYYGFQSLPFIARNARGIDVELPVPASAGPLLVDGPTVFAFLPERVAELDQIRAWYPGGDLREFHDHRDRPLLTTYRVAGR